MNERFDWRKQAAEMRDFLADQYVFVAETYNKYLGINPKADKSHKKEVHFRQEANAFRQKSEETQTSME